MQDNIMGIIYKITNTSNGKMYIGQTVQSMNNRFARHISDALSYRKGYRYPLANAIRFYGKDNFTCCILEECDDTCLDEREKYWIAHNDTFRNGYNATLGGKGATGIILSEEARRRISLANSNKLAGSKNPMYGKQHSELTLQKMKRPKNKTILSNQTITCTLFGLTEKQKQAYLAKKGIKLSEEHKQKISNALTGKTRSESHAINISKSKLGKKPTDLAKANMSIAQRNRNSSLKKFHEIVDMFTENGRTKVKYMCPDCKSIKMCRKEKYDIRQGLIICLHCIDGDEDAD